MSELFTRFTRFDSHSLAIILAMAVITYGMRLGGLLLADKFPQRGRWAYMLDRLPGTILISVWVPSALAAGPVGIAGVILTGGIMFVSRNIFLAIIAAMAFVALYRYFFGQ